MFRRFEAKGWLLDESNQEQFLAKKIHNLCEGLEDVTIPDSCTTIAADAFKDVQHITYNGTAEGSPLVHYQ